MVQKRGRKKVVKSRKTLHIDEDVHQQLVELRSKYEETTFSETIRKVIADGKAYFELTKKYP